MKLKIAYDPQIFSFQIYGGVSRYVCEIAFSIARSNVVNVKIVAPFSVCKYLESVDESIIAGFKAPSFKPLKLFFRLCSMAFGHIYLLVLNPKVIHETYFFPYALGPKKSKRVLTVHDMIHEKFSASRSSWDRASKYKAIAVRRADHIICTSEMTKRDLILLFNVDQEKITVIHHGCSVQNLSSKDLSLIDYILPPQFLLYVGYRQGYKNFKIFLEAYALSHEINCQFEIVCFGGEELSSEELKTFSQLGIPSERITHFSGGDDLLCHLYQNASAFIFPSLYEGFGFPPLEAMSNDCVVICSSAGSIPEVVDVAGEYFDPHDAEDIRRAMEKVLFQPERQRELRVLGRERIKQFSWKRCAEETLKIYERLAASN
jgi:glycosyltransferase involved in cell wall biosynthesis